MHYQQTMNSSQRKLSVLGFRFGMLGIILHVLSLFVASLGFNDFNGNGFSFFNFSLSELGQYGHSQLAVVFNGGLFFGSLSLVLFCLFSLQRCDRPLLYPCLLLLILAMLSLAITGLFPINVYHLHTLGIEYFFYFSLLSIGCYLGYLWQGARLAGNPPKHFAYQGCSVLSLLCIAVFGLFVFLAQVDSSLINSGQAFYHGMMMIEPRPEFWWPAILEWLALLLFLGWSAALVWTQRPMRD